MTPTTVGVFFIHRPPVAVWRDDASFFVRMKDQKEMERK